MQGKGLDLSIVISPKEIFESLRRNLNFISVAKLLRLSNIIDRIRMSRKSTHDHKTNRNNDFSINLSNEPRSNKTSLGGL